MKRTFSTELAYVFGIVFVARGVVLMEKADFGVSMVVAPAYLLYRWLSPVWSFVTFGMAEIFRTGHCDANERRAKHLVSLHAGARIINIPRPSRGYFLDGRSPMLPATPHAALVRSDICIGLLPAARKRA